MKKCFKCGEEKDLGLFYPHKKMKDGSLNKCKDCAKKDEFDRRRGPNRDVILAKDRARGSRQAVTYLKEYRARFPNKYKAHRAVNNAIRDGKLFKEPCCICGTNERVVGHHDDYAKILNVRWMCQGHHLQWHSQHGEGLNP